MVVGSTGFHETHSVKSNGNRTSGLNSLGLPGVVDDGLVVLETSEFCSQPSYQAIGTLDPG
jgi:hypothetical protein